MSLALGLAVLALAVLLGGLAAVWRDHGRRVMPGLGAFALVASAAIALLHLLPESFAEIAWGAPVAAAAAFFGPFLLERLIPHKPESEDSATLIVGFAAVLLHQAGEGTAIASLSRSGALSVSIILAIAAHTAPLAMVVAIQALESGGGGSSKGSARAALALVGCAAATTMGALSLDLVGAARIAVMRPWLVAAVAGLPLARALARAEQQSRSARREGQDHGPRRGPARPRRRDREPREGRLGARPLVVVARLGHRAARRRRRAPGLLA